MNIDKKLLLELMHRLSLQVIVVVLLIAVVSFLYLKLVDEVHLYDLLAIYATLAIIGIFLGRQEPDIRKTFKRWLDRIPDESDKRELLRYYERFVNPLLDSQIRNGLRLPNPLAYPGLATEVFWTKGMKWS